MSIPLALCADDFGLGAAVDEGILHLLRRGRLQAVSCLIGGASWAGNAAALAAAAGQASIGLHFNLTEGAPLSSAMRARHARWPGLLAVLRDTHLRRLPQQAVADELQAQWQAFESAFGRTPDHLDGHQHVHQLPGVRDVIMASLAGRQPRPALRNTTPLLGPGFGFKRLVIAATGGWALARSLERMDWPCNPALTGVYNFAAGRDYRRLMQAWLGRLPPHGAMLFCHPAWPVAPPAAGDAIAAARQREFEYLDSAAFESDLAQAGVSLGPVA